MRRNRGSRSGKGGNRARPVDWEGALFGVSLGGNSIYADWVVEPDFINQNLTDPTLMATRIQGNAFSNAGGGGFFYAFGIIVWNFVDPFLPPIEIPDPLVNADYDWIIRGVGHSVTAGGATSFIDIHNADDGGTWSSQARRRLGNDRSILAVFATETFVSAQFGIDVRCLLKE